MKAKLLILLLCVSSLALVPLIPTTITFSWTSQPGVDSFNLYTSDTLQLPLTNWLLLTNILGTNSSFSVLVTPGPQFYYLTASNFWGESGPSVVVSTPPVPTNSVLNIRKGP